MDSGDDDLKFRIIFSGDGAGKLRERVSDKLKEFMGEYTDDTLVEYVIVLLKNGRRKEEARNELNVFLGDDSGSFVSWLWDHLRSNVDLYTQSKESRPDEVAKQKPKESRPDELANQKPKESFLNLHNESERIKSDKFSKSRRSKDWKSTIRDPDEPPPLRSAVIANIHADDISYMRRSPSLQPVIQRKRDRSAEGGKIYERGQPDERSQLKISAIRSLRIQDSSHDPDIPDTTDHFMEDDGEYEFVQVTETTAPTYTDQYVEDVPEEHDAAIASDLGYSDDGYNNMDVQLARPGGRMGNDSVMLHYNAENVVDQKPQTYQNTPFSMANSYHNLTELSGGNYGPQVIKDNNNLVTANNGNVVPTIHAQREIQKALSSAVVSSTELCYAAVVRKSSAQQEAAPVTTSWPRAIRASPFAASRFGKVPFPRGILSPYRPSRALFPPLGVSLMSELRRKQKELPTMPNIHQFPLHRGTTIPIVHTVLDLVRDKRTHPKSITAPSCMILLPQHSKEGYKLKLKFVLLSHGGEAVMVSNMFEVVAKSEQRAVVAVEYDGGRFYGTLSGTSVMSEDIQALCHDGYNKLRSQTNSSLELY
ncbi:nucleotide-binding alpha-beta plait domain-containing protein, partial [Tanacetum coccineum]